MQWLIAFIVLGLLDVVTTHYALSSGIAQELNPWALFLYASWGVLGLLAAKVAGTALIAALRSPLKGRMRRVASGLTLGIMSLVVLNNALVIA